MIFLKDLNDWIYLTRNYFINNTITNEFVNYDYIYSTFFFEFVNLVIFLILVSFVVLEEGFDKKKRR